MSCNVLKDFVVIPYGRKNFLIQHTYQITNPRMMTLETGFHSSLVQVSVIKIIPMCVCVSLLILPRWLLLWIYQCFNLPSKTFMHILLIYGPLRRAAPGMSTTQFKTSCRVANSNGSCVCREMQNNINTRWCSSRSIQICTKQ